MFKEKRSFFERITGSVPYDEREQEDEVVLPKSPAHQISLDKPKPTSHADWLDNGTEEEEGELSVDVCQSNTEVIIQTMIAGVKPEDLNISVTREMLTIKGRREKPAELVNENYFQKELYWGAFSRVIMLPAEVEAEESEAIEKHGLLTIRLPKIDKARVQKLKIKSI